MLDTITFEGHGHYVYCRYTGPFELESLFDLAKEANEYCISHGYDAILMDITESQGDMGTFQRFKHGETISKFVNKTYRIALLARPDQQSDRIWENATQNRLLKTKVFTDLVLAEEWLQP